jgi:hypothetical protein
MKFRFTYFHVIKFATNPPGYNQPLLEETKDHIPGYQLAFL